MYEIPSEMVDKYYRMNPDEDDLLPAGGALQNGMIVLLESPVYKTDAENWDTLPEDEKYTGWKVNRWCRITELQSSVMDGTSVIRFVGVYENGEKMSRFYGVSHTWLVKKDSLPQPGFEQPDYSRFVLDKARGDVRDTTRSFGEEFVDPTPTTFNPTFREMGENFRSEIDWRNELKPERPEEYKEFEAFKQSPLLAGDARLSKPRMVVPEKTELPHLPYTAPEIEKRLAELPPENEPLYNTHQASDGDTAILRNSPGPY